MSSCHRTSASFQLSIWGALGVGLLVWRHHFRWWWDSAADASKIYSFYRRHKFLLAIQSEFGKHARTILFWPYIFFSGHSVCGFSRRVIVHLTFLDSGGISKCGNAGSGSGRNRYCVYCFWHIRIVWFEKRYPRAEVTQLIYEYLDWKHNLKETQQSCLNFSILI